MAAPTKTYKNELANYTITYEEDVPSNILELMAAELGKTKRKRFRKSHIYWFQNLGSNSYLVRTSAQKWFVQTDLGRVDAFPGDRIVIVWNNLVVYRTGRDLATVDRRDLSLLDRLELPFKGEGEDKWSVRSTEDTLRLRARWEPLSGNYAVACFVALMTPDSVADNHTDAGSFHYSVSPEGKISVSTSGEDVLEAVQTIINWFK